MKKRVQNERGIALVMVLLILTLVSIMGLSLMSLSINNVKMSAHEREHESAYYISEAGLATAEKKVEKTALKIKSEFDEKPNATLAQFYAALEAEILSPGIVYPSPDFDVVYEEKPIAAVTVLKSADGIAGKYVIKSTGVIGSEKRTVSRTILIHNVQALQFAVFSRTAELSGSSVLGNLGVSSTAAGSVNFGKGNPQVTGSIYVPRVSSAIAVTGPNTRPVVPYDGEVKVALPPFPEYPNTYKSYIKSKIVTGDKNSTELIDMTNESYTLTELNIGVGSTLTIKTGTTNKGLVIDSLIMKHGTINIVGSGNLTIYIRKTLSMSSSSKINFNSNTLADSTKLILYLQESNDMPTVSIGGGNSVHGSIYAQTANFDFGGSGVFEGHVFTGGTSVTIGGSAEIGSDLYPSLFYAPKAQFNLANGAEVQGLVVVDKFIGTGGTLTPKDIEYSALPYKVSPVRPILKNNFITKEPIREES